MPEALREAQQTGLETEKVQSEGNLQDLQCDSPGQPLHSQDTHYQFKKERK